MHNTLIVIQLLNCKQRKLLKHFSMQLLQKTYTVFAKLMNGLVNIDQLMMFVWSKLKRNNNAVEILKQGISLALCKYLNIPVIKVHRNKINIITNKTNEIQSDVYRFSCLINALKAYSLQKGWTPKGTAKCQTRWTLRTTYLFQ